MLQTVPLLKNYHLCSYDNFLKRIKAAIFSILHEYICYDTSIEIYVMIQGVITELVSWYFSSNTKKDENITLSCLIFVNIYHETSKS